MYNKRAVHLLGAIVASLVPLFVQAQSSVTLYGRLDAGITYVSNYAGSSAYRFEDGIWYGNRWGFKGVEDLGGGLSAIFTLENGFSLGTGKAFQNGALFGRQAFVGLNSKWGAFTLGNQYDFVWDYLNLGGFNLASEGTGYSSHQGDFDGYSGADRLNNAVKFSSADFGGARFGGMYEFGNVAGNFHQGSAWSAGGIFKGSAFRTAIVYTKINNPTGRQGFDPYAQLGVTTFLGQTVATINPATGVATDLFPNGIHVDSKGVFGAGALYIIGNLQLNALYNNINVKGYGTSSTMQVYQGGTQYYFAPDLFGIFDYQRTRFEESRWSRFSTGINYLFSKRTSVYAGADYLLANSGTRAAIGYAFSPSTTNKQVDVRIGMTQSF
ncbi:porin [Caballeronia udeis]|uniref:porin n=1 Tax=Caballeronia udeis TaxID=1232866 RepID=UPI00078190BE